MFLAWALCRVQGFVTMYERLPVFLAALWWGSLCSIGFVAVPMLFAHLPAPALAGFMRNNYF